MKSIRQHSLVTTIAIGLAGTLLCGGLCACSGSSGSGTNDGPYETMVITTTTLATTAADELDHITTTQTTPVATENVGYGDGNHDVYGGITEQHDVEELEPKVPTSYFKETINYAVTSSDGYVNVRHGPSTEYEAFSTVETGEIIIILAQEGDWVFYKAPAGPNGWIHLSGLTAVNETDWQAIMPTDSQKLSTPTTKTVTASDGANMRMGPSSTDYGVLFNVPMGQEVQVTAQSGDWYFCYFAQSCGWTHNSNLS